MKEKRERELWTKSRPRSSLTWESVDAIRASDLPVTTLAKQYCLSRRAIYNILNETSWNPKTRPSKEENK